MTSTNTVSRAWAVTVEPDQSHEVHPWPSQEDTLAFLQHHVQGYIERVPIAAEIDMWVNEEFIYTDMNPNPLATMVAWEAVPARILRQFYCGPAVFTGTADVEGHTLGLNEDQAAFVAGLLIELGRRGQDVADTITHAAHRWLAAYR